MTGSTGSRAIGLPVLFLRFSPPKELSSFFSPFVEILLDLEPPAKSGATHDKMGCGGVMPTRRAKKPLIKIRAKNSRSRKENVQAWFAAMDLARGEPLLKDGRNQPRAPRRKIFP